VQIINEDGQQVHLPPIVQNLFAYIVLTQYRNQFRNGLRRELLANLFWEDQPERNARRCLSTAIWRLRREFQLQPTINPDFISTTSDKVSLNFEFDHWLDIDQFEQAAIFGLNKSLEAMTIEQVESLEKSVNLYTGDLLEDCYEDWAIQERERLHLLYLRSLARLMRYYRRHGRYEECVQCGKQILQTDPLREQIHRELIMLYMENRQRGLAIHQYEMCRQILKRELGIEPMTETKLLYAQLMAEKRPFTPPTDPQPSPSMDQLMIQLKQAMANLDNAQNQLRNIQQTIISMNQT
jgi:DNA-binding SARP family transcriptional activator